MRKGLLRLGSGCRFRKDFGVTEVVGVIRFSSLLRTSGRGRVSAGPRVPARPVCLMFRLLPYPTLPQAHLVVGGGGPETEVAPSLVEGTAE